MFYLKIIFFQQDVFRIDALESSHPISIPVKHPAEISENEHSAVLKKVVKAQAAHIKSTKCNDSAPGNLVTLGTLDRRLVTFNTLMCL